MDRIDLFENLWQAYTRITPQAAEIHSLFIAQGEQIVNDHVAFRTFQHSAINVEALAQHFLRLGYREFDQYDFPTKKLSARAFIHDDADAPKVFISELRSDELSETAQGIIAGLCEQIDSQAAAREAVLWSGRLWQPIAYEGYTALLAESEYAAWLAVHGICANHFTVNVNRLKYSADLATVIATIKQAGYALNTSGGEIKGEPSDYLIQASTLADQKSMLFEGGEQHTVPSCYYEFAQRFELPNGEMYQGFVAANADKIFESTDIRS